MPAIKQNVPYKLKVVDASTGEERALTIIHDFHGMTVEINGTDESFVLDLSANRFTCWTANDYQDVDGKDHRNVHAPHILLGAE